MSRIHWQSSVFGVAVCAGAGWMMVSAMAQDTQAIRSPGASLKYENIEEGFRNPPDSAKPWVYWVWFAGGRKNRLQENHNC